MLLLTVAAAAQSTNLILTLTLALASTEKHSKQDLRTRKGIWEHPKLAK
jgi:hypothetical protein